MHEAAKCMLLLAAAFVALVVVLALVHSGALGAGW